MKNKDSKARMQVIFGVLLFAFVMSAELYAMINYSKMYILIVALAAIDLVCLYVVINGMFAIREVKDARSEEQYDSVFKSEKASYLMLKKYFEEIEDKLNYLEKASKVPTEEIINAQKGIAKVIINRNRENAEALINSNEQVMEQFMECSDTIAEITKLLSAYKDEIISEQQKTEEVNEQNIQVKMQDLVIQMKDMELRLNQAISQMQKVSYQQPVVAAPAYMPQTPMNAEVNEQPSVTEPEEKLTLDEEVPEDTELDMEDLADLDPGMDLDENSDIDDISELEDLDLGISDDLNMDSADDISEDLLDNLPEDIKDLDISEDALSDIDLSMGDDSIEEPVIEMDEPELEMVQPEVPEEEPLEEKAAEDIPPMPDLSDPNKTMSPDEIAALFANMAGDSPKEEVESEVVEPAITIEEPVEEKPPMPDLSDPNKNLSPDEIAALFANMQ